MNRGFLLFCGAVLLIFLVAYSLEGELLPPAMTPAPPTYDGPATFVEVTVVPPHQSTMTPAPPSIEFAIHDTNYSSSWKLVDLNNVGIPGLVLTDFGSRNIQVEWIDELSTHYVPEGKVLSIFLNGKTIINLRPSPDSNGWEMSAE